MFFAGNFNLTSEFHFVVNESSATFSLLKDVVSDGVDIWEDRTNRVITHTVLQLLLCAGCKIDPEVDQRELSLFFFVSDDKLAAIDDALGPLINDTRTYTRLQDALAEVHAKTGSLGSADRTLKEDDLLEVQEHDDAVDPPTLLEKHTTLHTLLSAFGGSLPLVFEIHACVHGVGRSSDRADTVAASTNPQYRKLKASLESLAPPLVNESNSWAARMAAMIKTLAVHLGSSALSLPPQIRAAPRDVAALLEELVAAKEYAKGGPERERVVLERLEWLLLHYPLIRRITQDVDPSCKYDTLKLLFDAVGVADPQNLQSFAACEGMLAHLQHHIKPLENGASPMAVIAQIKAGHAQQSDTAKASARAVTANADGSGGGSLSMTGPGGAAKMMEFNALVSPFLEKLRNINRMDPIRILDLIFVQDDMRFATVHHKKLQMAIATHPDLQALPDASIGYVFRTRELLTSSFQMGEGASTMVRKMDVLGDHYNATPAVATAAHRCQLTINQALQEISLVYSVLKGLDYVEFSLEQWLSDTSRQPFFLEKLKALVGASGVNVDQIDTLFGYVSNALFQAGSPLDDNKHRMAEIRRAFDDSIERINLLYRTSLLNCSSKFPDFEVGYVTPIFQNLQDSYDQNRQLTKSNPSLIRKLAALEQNEIDRRSKSQRKDRGEKGRSEKQDGGGGDAGSERKRLPKSDADWFYGLPTHSGDRLVREMPDGTLVWTSNGTQPALAAWKKELTKAWQDATSQPDVEPRYDSLLSSRKSPEGRAENAKKAAENQVLEPPDWKGIVSKHVISDFRAPLKN